MPDRWRMATKSKAETPATGSAREAGTDEASTHSPMETDMNEDTTITTTETNEATQAPAKAKKAAKTKTVGKKGAKKPAKPAKKAKGKKTPKKAAGAVVKGPAILRQYAPGYRKDNENKTAGGNPSIDNDDEVAQKFRGKDLDAVYGVAAKSLKVEVKELKGRYGKLNVGMQRMNLGNRMRAALNAK